VRAIPEEETKTLATHTKSALHTPLCDLLGIRYPICQAGMGWVARSALAAAVSEAGGLGVIAAAHGSPEYLREEIRRVRGATDRPFGVDVLFATIRAAGDEVEQFTDQVKGWIDVTLEERVPVLMPSPHQAQRVGFPAAIRAREDGDVDNGHAACGQSAGLIGEIISVRELIDRIVTEAEAALSRLCARYQENS
jgi:NAD(P)H-dependent flavin oxidoreductase YrpB (nitropropane dioxygenase family)